MNLSIKQVDRGCLIIVVLISLVCGYLTINHVIKRKKQFGIEKYILTQKMKEVNLASTNLGELKANLAATKKELDYLNERIPESGKMGLLLKQIGMLMKQRKITLVSLKPQPVREEKIYLKNPIHLKFKGDFVNIYYLIHDLEHMNRFLIMGKMTIIKQESSNRCQVELTISVFERKNALS
jgi:Tfp pilus assembly protein PilO